MKSCLIIAQIWKNFAWIWVDKFLPCSWDLFSVFATVTMLLSSVLIWLHYFSLGIEESMVSRTQTIWYAREKLATSIFITSQWCRRASSFTRNIKKIKNIKNEIHWMGGCGEYTLRKAKNLISSGGKTSHQVRKRSRVQTLLEHQLSRANALETMAS